jgi:hypothetical protein
MTGSGFTVMLTTRELEVPAIAAVTVNFICVVIPAGAVYVTAGPAVLESAPHADAEQELLPMVHDTGASPESDAVIWMDWPASIVMAEEDRLVMPPPAYPPEPQPVKATHAITAINRAAW